MTDFYGGVDIIVGLGFLLGEPPQGTAAHQDAGGLQVSARRITASAASGPMTALHSAGAMRGGKERGVIGDPGQHVGGGPHRAGYEHRLADGGKVGRQVGMVGRQRACRSFAVYADRAGPTVDVMDFDLGEVVVIRRIEDPTTSRCATPDISNR